MKNIFICAALTTVVGGCSVTLPVAVVRKGIPGGIMRGTTTASSQGGSFSVSN